MKLFREPLLHFAVAGALIFSAYSWINRGEPEALGVEPVRIGEGEVQWLTETWTNRRMRTPTTDELRGMIADFVNEELLAREAAEMGLGEGDTVVRRRLAQKLGFLIEDTSRLVDPSDEDLRQYHEANASRFQTPARISFAQIYFNPDKRKNAVSDATSTLELLAEGGGTPPQDLGDRLLVEGAFNDLDEQAVSNLFGADFAEAVLALEPGAWNGPIESGFGVHLVSVTEKTAATLPPLAEVREEVRSEWLRDQQAAATEAYLARLREKYGVIVEESVEPLLSGDTVGSLVSR